MKRTIGFIFILVLALATQVFWNIKQNQSFNSKVLTLQREIGNLQNQTMSLASSSRSFAAAISAQELLNRKQVVQKSQDQLLTSAVAKTAPAVVSIVISQYAPQYEVAYVNPFGDDPSLPDPGFRIPVYRQTGNTLKKVGAGTGILFRQDGYIVTNKHVIFDSSAQYTVLLSNGSQKTAKVIYRDLNNDIAIIKIDGSYKTIGSIGDSSGLKLGQTVAAIGNALGEYDNSVSVGIVSGLNRSITAQDETGKSETLSNIIQTDAAINPGNSGGPLIDLNGDIVGINVATVQGGNSISFSIPINSVKNILSNYK